MRTYRDLFRTPEFTPLFLVTTIQVAASTVSGLALATMIYKATGSPLLSALSMFGPSLAQVAGATALLSAADRLPPRATMAGMALLFGLGTAALAIPGLPVPAIFAIVLGTGVVGSLSGGVRYGLLNEILSRDGYLLGRSVLNMSVGAMQIAGYAAGGAMLLVLSAPGALLTAATLDLVAAVTALTGLRPRPPRATGRPSIAATWRDNRVLWSSVRRRYVYLALWVPNGLIVGCESLFVPYAPRYAGVMFAFAAAGMLIGDTLTGRFVPPWWRRRLSTPLRLLLAAPYLVFALRPAPAVAVAAVTIASVGYAAGLLLQERLMALTPDDLSGHALGLHSSGMLTMQGVGAALAGTVAGWTSPATAMVVMAVASVAVTLALTPGLRPDPVRARAAAGSGPAPSAAGPALTAGGSAPTAGGSAPAAGGPARGAGGTAGDAAGTSDSVAAWQ